MSEQPLSAVVEKPRAQAAIGSLRAEGVYDDDRSVYECGSETVAIPVTEPPAETAVLEVIRESGEPRLRTLADHLRERGWSEDDLDRAPGSWAVIGSVVLVEIGDAPRPAEVGEALLSMHGEADTVLAREGIAGDHREPSVTVLAGEGDTETVHREHGTVYATAFDQRFHPAHRKLRALLADGALGTPTQVRIHYACWTPPDWTPDPAYPHDNWRADRARAGGGAFLDLAPHGLDLTQMLLGERLTEATAFLQHRRVHDYDVDDGATLVGRSESGTLLSLDVAYNCPDAYPRRQLEVIGTEGRAFAENTMGQDAGGTLTITRPDGSESAVPFDPTAEPFARQIDAFSHALCTGEPFGFPPERDLHTMRLLSEAEPTADG